MNKPFFEHWSIDEGQTEMIKGLTKAMNVMARLMLSMEQETFIDILENRVNSCMKRPMGLPGNLIEGDSEPEDDLYHDDINHYKLYDVDVNLI